MWGMWQNVSPDPTAAPPCFSNTSMSSSPDNADKHISSEQMRHTPSAIQGFYLPLCPSSRVTPGWAPAEVWQHTRKQGHMSFSIWAWRWTFSSSCLFHFLSTTALAVVEIQHASSSLPRLWCSELFCNTQRLKCKQSSRVVADKSINSKPALQVCKGDINYLVFPSAWPTP